MKTKEALEEFIQDCMAAGRSKHTVKIYTSVIEAFCRYCDKELETITAPDVRAWLVHLRERKAYTNAPQKPESRDGLSPVTVSTYDRHLRSFFGWCESVGYIEKSPMKGMLQPRIPKRPPKAIKPHQFVRLMQAANDGSEQGRRNVALLAMLADTGARVSELLSLTVDTIDMGNQSAWVYAKGSERQIFFTRFTRNLINKWLDVQVTNTKYIFTSMTTGEPLTGSGVHQVLKRLKRDAQIRGRISAHRFRHGFAVAYIKAGGDISTLAALLGHNSISTTSSYYAVFDDTELKRLHDKINPLEKMMRGDSG